MMLLSILLILAYGAMILMLIYRWRSIASYKIGESKTKVTIIIPARNEADTVTTTIQSILQNDYPPELMQVLVVNDHSDDATVQCATEIDDHRLEILHLGIGKAGKKEAIAHGVQNAKGDLILCTDADSIVPNGWVAAHVSSYLSGSILSFGPVHYARTGLLSDMLDLELAALVMIGAVTAIKNQPTMINGCNYSFSKKAFDRVQGFNGNEEIPTGDDEFLLRKIADAGHQIGFVKSDSANVQTLPPNGMVDFISQRRRWASKWKHHSDVISKLMPMTVFVFFLLYVISMSVAIIHANYLMQVVVVGVKMICDITFLWHYARFWEKPPSILSFVIMQIIYPFYVLFFGLASNFGQYRWKGRVHEI